MDCYKSEMFEKYRFIQTPARGDGTFVFRRKDYFKSKCAADDERLYAKALTYQDSLDAAMAYVLVKELNVSFKE